MAFNPPKFRDVEAVGIHQPYFCPLYFGYTPLNDAFMSWFNSQPWPAEYQGDLVDPEEFESFEGKQWRTWKEGTIAREYPELGDLTPVYDSGEEKNRNLQGAPSVTPYVMPRAARFALKFGDYSIGFYFASFDLLGQWQRKLRVLDDLVVIERKGSGGEFGQNLEGPRFQIELDGIKKKKVLWPIIVFEENFETVVQTAAKKAGRNWSRQRVSQFLRDLEDDGFLLVFCHGREKANTAVTTILEAAIGCVVDRRFDPITYAAEPYLHRLRGIQIRIDRRASPIHQVPRGTVYDFEYPCLNNIAKTDWDGIGDPWKLWIAIARELKRERSARRIENDDIRRAGVELFGAKIPAGEDRDNLQRRAQGEGYRWPHIRGGCGDPVRRKILAQPRFCRDLGECQRFKNKRAYTMLHQSVERLHWVPWFGSRTPLTVLGAMASYANRAQLGWGSSKFRLYFGQQIFFVVDNGLVDETGLCHDAVGKGRVFLEFLGLATQIPGLWVKQNEVELQQAVRLRGGRFAFARWYFLAPGVTKGKWMTADLEGRTLNEAQAAAYLLKDKRFWERTPLRQNRPLRRKTNLQDALDYMNNVDNHQLDRFIPQDLRILRILHSQGRQLDGKSYKDAGLWARYSVGHQERLVDLWERWLGISGEA